MKVVRLTQKPLNQRFEPWHRARGYIIDFKRSYLQINSAHLDLLVGRDWLFWGASPFKTVGISDNSPPFDQIRLTGRLGKKFKATAFTMQLNSTWYDDGEKRYLAKRYMSGHRLDYQLNDRVEIGSLSGCFTVVMRRRWSGNTRIQSPFIFRYNTMPKPMIISCSPLMLRSVRLTVYGSTVNGLIDDIQYVRTSTIRMRSRGF